MVNGLKRTWNEAAEAQLDVLSQYLYGERGKSRKVSLRLFTGIVAEVGNQDLQNMKQKCYSPDRDIRWKINNKRI
jgi:hypothetical protein